MRHYICQNSLYTYNWWYLLHVHYTSINLISKKCIWGGRQDGRAERLEFTSSHENTKITTELLNNHWQKRLDATSGLEPVPPTRKYEQPHSLQSRHREARGTTILQSVEKRPQTQKVIQNEMAKKICSRWGTR